MFSHALRAFNRPISYCNDEDPPATPPQTLAPRTQKIVGEELTGCMLSQSYGFVAGTVIGFIFGYRGKSLTPLVQGVALGTVVDIAMGYCVMCKSLREEYDRLGASSEPTDGRSA